MSARGRELARDPATAIGAPGMSLQMTQTRSHPIRTNTLRRLSFVPHPSLPIAAHRDDRETIPVASAP
ncbi:MAG TPA: hypothetical protein VJL90_04145, partial [Pseudorhodoplanes sp.]|nr:hypothetical protein [Pseudorhodoplanes sp.]